MLNRQKSESISAVNVWFHLGTATVEDLEATDQRLTCCQQTNNCVFVHRFGWSSYWEGQAVKKKKGGGLEKKSKGEREKISSS